MLKRGQTYILSVEHLGEPAFGGEDERSAGSNRPGGGPVRLPCGFFGLDRRASGLGLGARLLLRPAPPLYVACLVGEHHGRAGCREADGSDHQPHRAHLLCEWVFDIRADRGFRRIGFSRTLRHRPSKRLLPLDAADLAEAREKPLVLRRVLGAVGPDIRGGVGRAVQPLA